MEEGKINTDFADAFKLRTRRQSVNIVKFLKTIKHKIN